MTEDEITRWLSSLLKRKEDRKDLYTQFKDLLQESHLSLDLSTKQKETLALIKLIIDNDKKHEDGLIDAYEMIALLLRRVMNLEDKVNQLKKCQADKINLCYYRHLLGEEKRGGEAA